MYIMTIVFIEKINLMIVIYNYEKLIKISMQI